MKVAIENGEAEIVGLREDLIELVANRSAPPGTRLGFVFEGASLRMKVHSCKREGDHYRIRGRLFEFSKDLAARIAKTLPANSEGGQRDTDRGDANEPPRTR